MLDFRRSDLTDKLYIRYLTSYGLTLETIDKTGKEAYKFILDTYTKSLKCDLKLLELELKHYFKFKEKERKHNYKLDKLNFIEKSLDDYESLCWSKRLLYKFNHYRFNKENKRFFAIKIKFKPWISNVFNSNVITEPVKTDKAEPILERPVDAFNVVKSNIDKGEAESIKLDSTVVDKKTVTASNGGIPLEEGKQMSIEEFFNEENKL